ncbi:MAG: DUF86 domain-containing protein [Campylobacterales bacterium]|nr:DUF86 domain-containing protein [Campylobacterales bacterium]
MEILEKLKQLEENILILKEIKNELSIEQIKEKKRFEWELRYGLFESIQIIIDISCKISSTYNLGNPKTYKECLELLSKFKYIEHELSKKLSSSVGLRNLLIHEYTTIDIEKLFGFLNFLDDFKSFAKQIKIVID